MPPFEKRACFCRIQCVFQQLVPRIRRGESGRAELGPLSPFVITPPTEVRAFPAWVERLRLTPHPPPLDRRSRRPLGFLPLRLPTFQRYSGRRGWFVAPLASSMSFPTVPSDVRRVGRLSVGSGAVRNSLELETRCHGTCGSVCSKRASGSWPAFCCQVCCRASLPRGLSRGLGTPLRRLASPCPPWRWRPCFVAAFAVEASRARVTRGTRRGLSFSG